MTTATLDELPVVASTRQVAPPPGYSEFVLHDPYEAQFGPFFERTENGTLTGAFMIDDRHVNDNGEVNEGMMLTFADFVLGITAHRLADDWVVTLSMQANWVAPAKLGDLVVCRPRLDRQTKSILFVSGEFFVGDRKVMTANSIWKVPAKR